MPHYFTVVPDGPITFADADSTDGNVYHLTLMNFGKVPVAFKFQTTAPQLFCCKPVVGFIGPNRQVTVGILLKAWKLPTTDNLPRQHSFKLMGYPTATVDHNSPRTFWTTREVLHSDKLETRFFDVSISANFRRWIRMPNHIGVNTDELEVFEQGAQTHDLLPHAMRRRPTVDLLVDQMESKGPMHFWLSRPSSTTDIETDHSVTELSVTPEIRHWDSLNAKFL
uniref:Major sperm protein n=1 Tax=Plectus sambesii TaxID=2011161 RepID=A0A914XF77_9BILA